MKKVMRSSKKGLKIALLVVFAVFTLAFTVTSVYADTQHMNWYQYGKKSANSGTVYTKFSGEVNATFEGRSGFLWLDRNYSHQWIGTSRSYANSTAGVADSIKHTDYIWVNAKSNSYSAGVNAGAETSVAVGVSTTQTSDGVGYTYSLLDTSQLYVDYSYYATSINWSYMGQKTSGTFLYGYRFTVVDSEVDQYYEYKSDIWFT